MTDRNRLIELLVNFNQYKDPIRAAADRMIIEKIADYLLANGVIVPPLKLGNKIYQIFGNKIVKIEVSDIEIIFRHSCGTVRKKYLYNYNAFTNDDFGKTVFLTKEEAEKALKEREG